MISYLLLLSVTMTSTSPNFWNFHSKKMWNNNNLLRHNFQPKLFHNSRNWSLSCQKCKTNAKRTWLSKPDSIDSLSDLKAKTYRKSEKNSTPYKFLSLILAANPTLSSFVVHAKTLTSVAANWQRCTKTSWRTTIRYLITYVCQIISFLISCIEIYAVF